MAEKEKQEAEAEEKTTITIPDKKPSWWILAILVPLLLNLLFTVLTYKSTSSLQKEKSSLDVIVENKKTYNSLLVDKNHYLINQQSKIKFNYFYGWSDFYEAKKSKDKTKMKSILKRIEENFLIDWNIYQQSKPLLSKTNIQCVDKFLEFVDVDGNFFKISDSYNILLKQKHITYFYGIQELIESKDYLTENNRERTLERRLFAIQYFPRVLSEAITDELKINADLLLQERVASR